MNDNQRKCIVKWFERLARRNVFNTIGDKEYLKLSYFIKIGKKLNLDNPTSFNEKLQWLKINDRREEHVIMVDKYNVKKYVSDLIGEEYIIPVIGLYNSFEEIDFDSLPDSFVIKCTHDSGGIVIVDDKSKMNIEKAKRRINKSLNYSYYWLGREWPYKNVPRKILIEEYLTDDSSSELRDYKFFCFNGKVKCFKVDFGRFSEHHANYFDADKKIIHFGEKVYPPVYEERIEMPKSIDKMIELAEKLSSKEIFVRADFYEARGGEDLFWRVNLLSGIRFRRVCAKGVG